MSIESRSRDSRQRNAESQQFWERKAEFWDERMGEGRFDAAMCNMALQDMTNS